MNFQIIHLYQKTSKKCSSDSKDDKNAQSTVYNCEFCSYNSPFKYSIDRHIQTCVGYKNNKIETLKHELENLLLESNTKQKELESTIEKLKYENVFLKGRIQGICDGTRKTNKLHIENTREYDTISEPVSLTREYIDNNIHLYTIDLFRQGAIGLVKFFELLMTDNKKKGRSYKCRDQSRKKFSRFTENGVWKDDFKGEFILQNLYDSIKESGVIDNYWNEVLKNKKTPDEILENIQFVTYGIDDKKGDYRTKLHKEFIKELIILLSKTED